MGEPCGVATIPTLAGLREVLHCWQKAGRVCAWGDDEPVWRYFFWSLVASGRIPDLQKANSAAATGSAEPNATAAAAPAMLSKLQGFPDSMQVLPAIYSRVPASAER